MSAATVAALAQAPRTLEPPIPEIRDIAPPIDVFPYPLWMVIVACIAALALAFGVAWLVRRRIRNRPPPLPVSPRTTALRQLEKLRSQLRSLESHPFSIAVSDVLRSYIRAAYGLHATQQTSPEFLMTISNATEFTDADRKLLAEFLERCDLIKFARVDASTEDSAGLLESAFAFVQGGRV